MGLDLQAIKAKQTNLNAQEIGNDRLFMELAGVIGTASQTLEEAFLTAVRTRMAEDKGRAFLAQALASHRGGATGGNGG